MRGFRQNSGDNGSGPQQYLQKILLQTILSNIDVTFTKGSTTGISGRNGSGKATLLKAFQDI
ncbi:MAG: ATP-binding cassette domain-containing protein [Saprospiraceae bacterium]|nr:ATP-binding cassette domain-containing protein [Saprospiraceae bacterium]